MTPAQLANPATDFPGWYQEVLDKAEVVENGPVKGTMVIRPYGYAIWEQIRDALDHRIRRAGAQNVSLPMLIPQSYLEREAEHVEGFAPEVAVVTQAGGKELAEPLVLRPTSETLFGQAMARWINSYRDLPMALNQWANVIRWELRPRLLLRSSEFLWQEGHTAHASRDDAAGWARRILAEVYRDVLVDVLAMPVLGGCKPGDERFAGAIGTFTCEGVMPDGKALQLATTHELGQNFSRAFDITFSDVDGRERHAWTTSWGASTRLLGGLIMQHGDERGLRLPPAVAPTQVIVMPIGDDEPVQACSRELVDRLDRQAQVRVALDRDVHRSFGRRVTSWELKGVPIRLVVGSKELASGSAEISRRDEAGHLQLGFEETIERVPALLAEIQSSMLEQARSRVDGAITDVCSVAEAASAAKDGLARLPYEAIEPVGERPLRSVGITIRCLKRPDGSVPAGPDDRDLVALVARAY